MSPSLVEVTELAHVYEGGVRALDGLTASFGTGEFVAVVGSNGSGKTTLVKHFNGLLRPSEGAVLVGGKSTSVTPVAELSRTVGFVFQNPDQQIFANSVLDEVMFGLRVQHFPRDECLTRSLSALEKVGLASLTDRHPRALSRGQRQRLATASVLAMDTPLLVLDEPTTGQDFRARRQIMGLVSTLHREGKSIVMVTHDMALVAEFAGRAIVMSEGRTIFDGPPAAVFADQELMDHAHLAAPDTVRIARYMREHGIEVPAYSIEALSEAFIEATTAPTGWDGHLSGRGG